MTNLAAMLPDFLRDVQIEAGTLPLTLADATSRGVLWQASPGRFLLEVPEVAHYLVEDGQRVMVDAKKDTTAEDVVRFLRMTPLAALCYQRNAPVFHAAAVAMPGRDGCILLAGASGVGKSTLLAVLLQRGWRLLADDLAVVDTKEGGNMVVYPTFSEVFLWADGMKRLGLETSNNVGKRSVFSWNNRFVAKPLPLRAVYWLSADNRGGLELAEIEGSKRFQAMGLLAYNSHIADALMDTKEYFRQASIFAQSIPTYCLRRPCGCWSADELANIVERNTI